MKTEKYQFIAIVSVFTFGFFSHDFIHGTENGDDVYYQEESETLQCTVNIDCDNVYDLTVLFPGKLISEYMESLEFQKNQDITVLVSNDLASENKFL